jgi:hypothetical protein
MKMLKGYLLLLLLLSQEIYSLCDDISNRREACDDFRRVIDSVKNSDTLVLPHNMGYTFANSYEACIELKQSKSREAAFLGGLSVVAGSIILGALTGGAGLMGMLGGLGGGAIAAGGLGIQGGIVVLSLLGTGAGFTFHKFTSDDCYHQTSQRLWKHIHSLRKDTYYNSNNQKVLFEGEFLDNLPYYGKLYNRDGIEIYNGGFMKGIPSICK